MHTSRYTRLVDLPEPTEEGMTHVAYNTVAGSLMAVNEELAQILEKGLTEQLTLDDFAPTEQETLADLLTEGWLLIDDQWEENRIEAIGQRISSALLEVSEYGLVPWPDENPGVEPDLAMETLTALAEVEEKPNRQYHFHVLAQEHVGVLERSLPAFFAHLATDDPSLADGRLVALTLDPAVTIDWAPWGELTGGEARLRLPLYFDESGEGVSERIDRIADVAAEAAQIGFISWVVIHMTAETPEEWLDEALTGLVESGILQACTRPPAVVARNRIDDWRGLLCDLNNLDFELTKLLFEQAEQSRRRRMLRIYGGGLIDLVHGMVSRRAGLMHELFFCRPMSTGYYANLAGEIWPCPMMAAGLASEADVVPLATFDRSGINAEPETVARWRGRNVLSLESCAGCAGMLNCAGGCALEALQSSDGDIYAQACQPVEELMEAVVQTQQGRLTRAFGPAGGGSV